MNGLNLAYYTNPAKQQVTLESGEQVAVLVLEYVGGFPEIAPHFWAVVKGQPGAGGRTAQEAIDRALALYGQGIVRAA